MLQKQLKELKATFNKAKKNKVNRLIVIHGVGEGVLKNEVRTYLENQSGIEFYDSDFREYGKGATTIDFHPNW
jgi:DNA-nicking Smr family endonuclease